MIPAGVSSENSCKGCFVNNNFVNNSKTKHIIVSGLSLDDDWNNLKSYFLES